jgi:capsular exopolysaccharide synthesis family protein
MVDDRTRAGPTGTHTGRNTVGIERGPATDRSRQEEVVPDDFLPSRRGIHLLDYIRIIYKRRWTAATAFLVVLTGAAIYTYRAVPIYEARVRLLIEPDSPNIVGFQEVVEQGSNAASYYQTQYTLLKSRALARRSVEALRYWNDPALGGKPGVQRAEGAVSTGGNDTRMPTPGDIREETPAETRAIDRFLGGLSVSPVDNSRVVEIRYRSATPAFASRAANAHAKEYVEQNLEFKFLASQEATGWLSERLTEQRRKVEDSEAALQKYREVNDAVSLSDRQNIVVQKLADLNAVVTRAKTARIEKEALFNQIQALDGDRVKLDTFPAIVTNQFIQQQKIELAELHRQLAQLSERLGDKHPEMIKLKATVEGAEARLNGEIAKVVQSVESEFLAAKAQEESLVAALENQTREALTLDRRGIEYGVLEREAQSNRQIYESLLQRAKETGISSELKTSNIRIVDPATLPRGPVWPDKLRTMQTGALGGLVLGLALAFLFEYLDNRMKSPEELTEHLGLPFLGLVPALSAKALNGTDPLINNGVPPNFAEAFKSVRTNVLFATAEEGARSIAITSTGPGEGKTLVASNLAIALAQAGQRVLLIDGDLRRPRINTLFGRNAEPGLSNLMVGEAKASEVVTKSELPGLWLLPSGVVPPNPAEILGSERFRTFLGQLDEHFDWVLIDTPPVMAVTDAIVVAHEVSGVLFVVGAEMTSRHAARTAVDRLASARAHLLGGVLNRVQLDRNPYYYSQYYRREYGDYYTRPPAAAS